MIDQTLLESLQYALVEPPDGGASWPSGLWTLGEVCGYADQRQNRLLKETRLRLTTAPPIACPAGAFRFALPTDWIATVEVLYTGDEGTIRHLQRSDSFEADHAQPGWMYNRNWPQVYMEHDPGTLQIQIAPAPRVAGILTLRYVAAAAPLTGDGIALDVPDLLAHALKYGVLADCLGKDGRAHDAARADYARQRYELAIEWTRMLLAGGA